MEIQYGGFLCWVALVLVLSLLSRPPCLVAEEIQYGPLVKEDERRIVVRTDYGSVSAVDIDDGYGGTYHLQFISLEPNSLFLPVLLLSDMVFYVHTGKGSLSWIEEEEVEEESTSQFNRLDLQIGDIYRIKMGSIFYVRTQQQNSTGEKLRIHAFFGNKKNEQREGAFNGAYLDVAHLILGLDQQVLRMGLNVSEEVIESLKGAEKPPPIVPYTQQKQQKHQEESTEVAEVAAEGEEEFLEVMISGRSLKNIVGNKKKKSKSEETFNVFKEKPDFENCYGSSITVTKKDLKALKGSDVGGAFMVNLTKGAMMGPRWNPTAVDICIVTKGQGMVQIVYPNVTTTESSQNDYEQRISTSFRVEEGDVFVVPTYHPTAQMSFNDGPLVFVGFTTTTTRDTENKYKNPHYLFGRRSVFQVLNKDILSLSFNVPITTIDEVFSSKAEVIIVDCTSCAEEVERGMEDMRGGGRRRRRRRERKGQEGGELEEEEKGKTLT